MSLASASKVKSLAFSPQKLPCLRIEDSTFFELLKVCGAPEKFLENGIFWRSPKNFF